MERLSRDEVEMELARIVSRRGTCSRLQVGVVFSRQGRVISTGYNGAPAGVPHCVHEEWIPGSNEPMPPLMAEMVRKAVRGDPIYSMLENMNPDTRWVLDTNGTERRISVTHIDKNDVGCKVAGHAEANGIAFAARHGLSLEGATASSTHMPCYNCAMLLINAGVERVIFDLPYRDRSGVDLLGSTGIEVVDFSSLQGVE